MSIEWYGRRWIPILKYIKLAARFKEKIEDIICLGCQRTYLIFLSVDFDDDFEMVKGENVVVNAYCCICDVESEVVIQIKVD